MSDSSRNYEFKVIFLGQEKSGKTSLISRIADNIFEERIEDFDVKTVSISLDNIKVQLHLNDFSASKSQNLTSSYYRNTDVIVLIFSVTDKQSFEEVDPFYKDGNHYSQRSIKYLIGNKIDNPTRAVTTDEAQNYAEKLGMKYFEVSSKTGDNVEKTFREIGEELLRNESGAGEIEFEVDASSKKKKKKKDCVIS